MKFQSARLRRRILAGDCLIIQRYKKGKLTIQLVDGAHIGTPIGRVLNTPNGNKIH